MWPATGMSSVAATQAWRVHCLENHLFWAVVELVNSRMASAS
jgi:hypothetical protein